MAACSRGSANPTQSPTVAPPAQSESIAGFARAGGPPRHFRFPADHGSHLEYQTEWWYFTGNLEAPDGRRFGYQLTFFRRALLPWVLAPPRPSNWGTGNVYMGHFALTDVAGGTHQAFERFGRGAAGIAGAQAEPFAVWLQDWRVDALPQQPGDCPLSAPGSPCLFRLQAAADDGSPVALDLTLRDHSGPVLQGDQGYSRKGAEEGQASYYYSLPRLETQGSLQLGGEQWKVSGLSWMDHEFSTSALAQNQVGWDWFSIQLQDGSELMVYQIRRADGSLDPYSSGTLIARDGSTIHLEQADFQIEAQGTWKSPRSGAVYPSGWRLRVPGAGLDLQIQPLVQDQELNVSYAYWEGAVDVRGERNGQPVLGSGYVELTGYSGSMGGEF